MGILGANQYEPATTFALTVMLVAPAVLLWLSWQHRRSITEIIALATVTSLLLGGTWLGASQVNDYWFGPTHASSSEPGLRADRVEWIWLGGLSSDSVTVTAELAEGRTEAVLVVEAVGGGPTWRSAPVSAAADPAVRLGVDGLGADVEYDFHLEVDGVADTSRGRGSFRTPAEAPASFTVAVGACARTGTNGAVFDAIGALDPLMMVHLGDLHYSDLASSDPEVHREAMRRFLTSPGPAALTRTVPMAYIWDDHDYGPNDGDATSLGRDAVRANYRTSSPHYELAEPEDGSINQAFTIGRVRFVMTDCRSERIGDTMLGEDQFAWLIEEITTASRTHALAVWGNPDPWIAGASPGGDYWNGYAEERRVIADALAAAEVDNLVMISGDAHMVAIDDGSNTDFSRTVGGFPGLAGRRIGPAGKHQGRPVLARSSRVVASSDPRSRRRRNRITATLAGHTWDGKVLVEETFEFPGDPTGP